MPDTDIAPLAKASVYCVIVVASVNVPAASSYVEVIPVPAVTKEFTLSSTLSLVKYKFEPSPISPVSKVPLAPSAIEVPFTVIVELVKLLLGILDKAKSISLLVSSYVTLIPPVSSPPSIPPITSCTCSFVSCVEDMVRVLDASS